MLWLAFKILLQERGRLVITLLGIVFSTVLTLVEVAIYLGMMGNATSVVRHTDADIWIVSKNIPNFDFTQPFPAYRINRVRALDEVLWAEKIHVWFAFLKLADGRREQAQVIGFNPDSGIGGPWSMSVGVPADVKGGPYIIMDESSRQRLGKLELGSLWELNLFREQSFKLVGLSREALSFTTIPVLFTSYFQVDKNLMGTDFEGQTSFIVAKLKDPDKLESVLKTMSALLGFVIGVVLTFGLRNGIERAGVAMQMPTILLAIVLAVIMTTCLGAAYISVRKVKSLDPVMVFRE